MESDQPIIPRNWSRILIGILILCFLIPILTYAYVGGHSRFMADEFCFAASTWGKGLYNAMYDRYMVWTGRFSATFLDYAIGGLGPGTSRVSPGIGLALWLSSLIAMFYYWISTDSKKSRLYLALLLGSLILFATLTITPSIGQSLYWGAGMHPVIPPLILFTMYLALLGCYNGRSVTKLAKTSTLILAVMITFIAAGFSEAFTAMQFALLFLAVLVGWIYPNRFFKPKLQPIFLASLFACVLAIIIILLAPGNQARRAFHPPTPGLLEIIQIIPTSMTFFAGRIFLADVPLSASLILQRLFTWMSVVLLPMLLGSGILYSEDIAAPNPKIFNKRLLFWLPLFTFSLLLLSFIPPAVGMSENLPRRTQIIPLYFLILSAALWGYAAGGILRPKINQVSMQRNVASLRMATVVTIIIICLNGLWAAWLALDSLPVYQDYAQAWDEWDLTIKDRIRIGENPVYIYPLQNPVGLDELTPDIDHWLNECLARYYGVPIIGDTEYR